MTIIWLRKNLEDMYLSTELTIMAKGGVSIQACKSLLIEKSAYFKAMFENEMVESCTSVVTLKNYSPLTIKLFLFYCATDELCSRFLTGSTLAEFIKFCHYVQSPIPYEKIEISAAGLNVNDCIQIMNLFDKTSSEAEDKFYSVCCEHVASYIFSFKKDSWKSLSFAQLVDVAQFVKPPTPFIRKLCLDFKAKETSFNIVFDRFGRSTFSLTLVDNYYILRHLETVSQFAQQKTSTAILSVCVETGGTVVWEFEHFVYDNKNTALQVPADYMQRKITEQGATNKPSKGTVTGMINIKVTPSKSTQFMLLCAAWVANRPNFHAAKMTKKIDPIEVIAYIHSAAKGPEISAEKKVILDSVLDCYLSRYFYVLARIDQLSHLSRLSKQAVGRLLSNDELCAESEWKVLKFLLLWSIEFDREEIDEKNNDEEIEYWGASLEEDIQGQIVFYSQSNDGDAVETNDVSGKKIVGVKKSDGIVQYEINKLEIFRDISDLLPLIRFPFINKKQFQILPPKAKRCLKAFCSVCTPLLNEALALRLCPGAMQESISTKKHKLLKIFEKDETEINQQRKCARKFKFFEPKTIPALDWDSQNFLAFPF